MLGVSVAGSRAQSTRGSRWRSATAEELKTMIPARAPVVSERIETETRTASGVVDTHGRYIAGVVLITAGYSANGKYSDYLVTQVPMKLGETVLQPGGYLLGWTRTVDDLDVTISAATTGDAVVHVKAVRNAGMKRIESFHIWPPSSESVIQLGRFTIDYSIP